MAMLTIASGRTLDGTGTGLILSLATEIEKTLGAWGHIAFICWPYRLRRCLA